MVPPLAELVGEILAGLPEAHREAGGDGLTPAGVVTTCARGERAFAVLGPSGIEIRLDAAIAAAAARTPDTAPSPRGMDWVRFNPREMDAHAADRLRAWLELAYGRAGS